MQFCTVQQAPSESEDDLKFFGTRRTQRTDAQGVPVGGAKGSSGELIAWKSQLTSSSRHRAMCKPEIGQEGASLQDTSCLKRACSKKHSERRKPYSSRGCTSRSTSKHVLQTKVSKQQDTKICSIGSSGQDCVPYHFGSLRRQAGESEQAKQAKGCNGLHVTSRVCSGIRIHSSTSPVACSCSYSP